MTDDQKKLLTEKLLGEIAALKAEYEHKLDLEMDHRITQDKQIAALQAENLNLYEASRKTIERQAKDLAGNTNECQNCKRYRKALECIANHITGEAGDGDDMRQEAQDALKQEEAAIEWIGKREKGLFRLIGKVPTPLTEGE